MMLKQRLTQHGLEKKLLITCKTWLKLMLKRKMMNELVTRSILLDNVMFT